MSWTTGLGAAKVERKCTRIEIKPHNREGIAAGVNQLLSLKWATIANPNCTDPKALKHFLITYEELSPISAIYRARILHVTKAIQTEVNRRGWSISKLPFIELGPLSVPRVNKTMLVRECHTARGQALEAAIRVRYAQELSRRHSSDPVLYPSAKSGSATGPDIDHEYAEFLAELAAELQAASN